MTTEAPAPVLMVPLQTPLANGAASAPELAAPLVSPSRQPDTVVRLAGVSKSFGAHPAIEGISLEVKRGEILGIIGRSGAGKSTLIRCLNGLERPDLGSIEVLGQDIVPLGERALRQVRSRIGMIFQHFNLLSAKTVAQNVGLPLKIAGESRSAREARVEALLQWVGLEAKAHAYPAQLSGGQKQRVGIARALAADPALLLSDEATSALDPETTVSILALLRDINRKLGLTIVLITHEMSVIRAIADRLIVLDQGRIVEEGETQNIFAAPRAEITKRLIASAGHGTGASPIGDLAAEGQPGLAAVFRLTLRGPLAGEPVLMELARALAIDPIIISADALRDAGTPGVAIVFALADASPQFAQEADRYLAGRDAKLEILGYAQRPA